MIKLKYPDINILFIDEIFANIDSAIVDEIIKILDIVSRDLELNIGIINHAPIDNGLFSNIIQIDKTKGFSNLSYKAI